ncbi:MAG: DUF4124 domain-containing protein [Burkholderiales bacterium]|nr:DUF4124 domain-containing protein [Burkholderiales bacterium]
MIRSLRFGTCACIFLTLLALAAGSFAADGTDAKRRAFKWTDANGVVHYSDTLPPEAANRERSELDRQGRTRRTVDPNAVAKSAAEKDKADSQNTIAPRDRALLASYLTEQDFDVARSKALVAVDQQVSSEQLMLKQRLDRKGVLLKDQAAGLVTPIGELESLDFEISRLEVSLRRLQTERDKISIKYQIDKDRWLELKKKSEEISQNATH